jgi:signal transduction histidine kinase
MAQLRNACKFTPTGGKITISTKLIIPTKESLKANGRPYTESRKTSLAVMDDTSRNELSVDHLSQHNMGDPKSELECIVVRIEVSDTGCGIHQKDMEQGKLFSE